MASVLANIEDAFPASDNDLDKELSRVLVYLNAPTVVQKTLALMEKQYGEDPLAAAELVNGDAVASVFDWRDSDSGSDATGTRAARSDDGLRPFRSTLQPALAALWYYAFATRCRFKFCGAVTAIGDRFGGFVGQAF